MYASDMGVDMIYWHLVCLLFFCRNLGVANVFLSSYFFPGACSELVGSDYTRGQEGNTLSQQRSAVFDGGVVVYIVMFWEFKYE